MLGTCRIVPSHHPLPGRQDQVSLLREVSVYEIYLRLYFLNRWAAPIRELNLNAESAVRVPPTPPGQTFLISLYYPTHVLRNTGWGISRLTPLHPTNGMSYAPGSQYTGCHRRNGPNFGRVFLVLNYADITQNTHVQSWTVSEIMASEVWNFDSCYTLIDYQIHIETGRNMWFL